MLSDGTSILQYMLACTNPVSKKISLIHYSLVICSQGREMMKRKIQKHFIQFITYIVFHFTRIVFSIFLPLKDIEASNGFPFFFFRHTSTYFEQTILYIVLFLLVHHNQAFFIISHINCFVNIHYKKIMK